MTDEKRAEIGALVCKGAEAVGYKGLATFEFLRDANGDFYFLEVNPRVQVEHTVTELITGHNLVELGVRVAQGEALPLSQDDIAWRGHAIQCRLNAEDRVSSFPVPADCGNAISPADLVFAAIRMPIPVTKCRVALIRFSPSYWCGAGTEKTLFVV